MENECRKPLLDGSRDGQPTSPSGRKEEKDCGTVTGPRNVQCATKDGSIAKHKWDTPAIEEEVKRQVLIALPMVLVNFLQYSVLVVSIMFVGHLGELELASASLANSIASVLGLYILFGVLGF